MFRQQRFAGPAGRGVAIFGGLLGNTTGGASGATILAQANFEDGTLGSFTDPRGLFGTENASPTMQVVDDPTGLFGGKVLQLNYIVADGDSNLYLQWAMPNGGIHLGEQITVMWDLAFPHGIISVAGMSRKVLYFLNEAVPHSFAILDIFSQYEFPLGSGVIYENVLCAVNIATDLSGDSPQANVPLCPIRLGKKYTIEASLLPPSTWGGTDSRQQVWVNGIKVYDTTGLPWSFADWAPTYDPTQPLWGVCEIGTQSNFDTVPGDAANDYRYLDNILAGTGRLGTDAPNVCKRLTLSLASTTLPTLIDTTITAIPQNDAEIVMTGQTYTLSSSDDTIATASASGDAITIHPIAAGTADISVTCNGVTAVHTATVVAAIDVDSLSGTGDLVAHTSDLGHAWEYATGFGTSGLILTTSDGVYNSNGAMVVGLSQATPSGANYRVGLWVFPTDLTTRTQIGPALGCDATGNGYWLDYDSANFDAELSIALLQPGAGWAVMGPGGGTFVPYTPSVGVPFLLEIERVGTTLTAYVNKVAVISLVLSGTSPETILSGAGMAGFAEVRDIAATTGQHAQKFFAYAPTPAASLTLSKTSGTLGFGETDTFTATMTSAAGDDITSDVEFSVDAGNQVDVGYAVVDGNSITVTSVGVGAGPATITVKSGGLTATYLLTSTQTFTSISLSPSSGATTVGTNLTTTATALDQNGSPLATQLPLYTTSSDEGVATANVSGQTVTIIPVAAGGPATITVSYGQGAISATYPVTVS